MIEFLRNVEDMPIGQPVIGKNSEAFARGDALYIDTDGFLAKITTSSKVFAYAIEDITMASDNQTVAMYCPQYIYADGVEIIVDTDQAVTQTDIGAYADMGTVTSNAMVLNLAAGSSGQFFVLGYVADNTSKAIVTVAEPQNYAFAQA